MTAEEFERQYAERSGISVQHLRDLGRVVRPCDCDSETCEGWQSISQERAAEAPSVVEKPLHAYFPSDVNAGSRSPCVHCGQAYDAHVRPPVVENPPA